MLINTSVFIENEIPKMHPASEEYINYWTEMKRRCIEGHWQLGRWMPGPLYFYINFWHILLSKSSSAKTKSIGRPMLRDIEWMLAYYWAEARGLGGFENTDFDKKGYNIREHLWNTTESEGRPLLEMNEAKNLMMLGSRNFGKDLEENTVVFKETGPVSIKDVAIGDSVYGADGNLTKIIDKVNYTNLIQYEVEFDDGRVITCGDGHLWEIYYSGTNETIVLPLKEIRKRYLGYTRSNGERDKKMFVKLSQPVQYPEKELKIDPYYLGIWLGDGSKHNTSITTADHEVVDFIYEYADSLNMTVSKNIKANGANKASNYLIKEKFRGIGNRLKTLLDGYNLTNNKHIPHDYLYASYEQRLALLQGLLDSDGCCNGDNGSIEFSNKNKILAEQTTSLARSLGIKTRMTSRIIKSIKGRGYLDQSQTYYRVYMKTGLSVFRIQRKLDNIITPISNTGLTNRTKCAIVDIRDVGVKPSICIAVDNEDKLFLAGDYVVTHNSYFTAGAIIAHEWLFDGAKEYIHPQDPEFSQESTTVVVGAGDAKYSGDLLKKLKFGLDKLPGGIEINSKYYPCPFSKQYMGSLMAGKEIVATYKKKRGSNWEYAGSGSNIKHRTFKDDPYAANGIRASVMVMEEAGLFSNLKASHDASVDCMRDGLKKFGSAIYLGTGGDMDKGTIDASIMFNDPDTYDILAFKDEWEHKPKIGLFIPAYYALNNHKDKDGNTNIAAARAELESKREELRKGRSGGETIDSELQNRPLVPSEMFLVKRGNKFHIDTIRKRLQVLESNNTFELMEKRVELYSDSNGTNGVGYKILNHGEGHPAMNIFPPPQNIKSRDGCVVIYEFPREIDGVVPSDAYVIGVDPYAIEDPNGESLAAVFVLKTKKYFADIGYDEIVAAYVGRPEDGRHIVNRNIELLAQMYGNGTGMIYFENTRGNVKEYFEKNKKLRLLARQPDTVFAKTASGKKISNIVYGYSLDNKHMKEQALDYVRDWAWMERGTDENGRVIRNYDKIYDRALLQEMAGFNMEANFDRVMALCGCIIGAEETHNQYITQKETKQSDILDFINSKFGKKKRPIYAKF